MNANFISLDLFALRVYAQPKSNSWSVLITDAETMSSKVEELKEEIEVISDLSVSILSALEDPETLLRNLAESISDYYLIWNFEAWDANQWQAFDMLRSHLDREAFGGALLLSKQPVNLLFDHAPNLTSWIGGRVYSIEERSDFLTEEERERRLDGFRTHYNYSDDEVVDFASRKEISLNPDIGEWLILLGREDLIERN